MIVKNHVSRLSFQRIRLFRQSVVLRLQHLRGKKKPRSIKLQGYFILIVPKNQQPIRIVFIIVFLEDM
ncbi:hypothetical protein QUF54_00220 [Candidatus Marithioploca araucensis]|uniref:Uncharacterized protein n=1 Tax=Candidatus Marithioploca araucensis TaxID=70273 RepID=A0ABT7VQ20_9GAMM|nr:hypothetical protein [Candidatus Marithioploca araucensis]